MIITIDREFQVNTFTQGGQYDPAVAIAPNGSFVVVWTSRNQNEEGRGADDVYGQRFAADGTPAGSEFRVNVTVEGNQRNPSVAMDGQGNFTIVWEGEGIGDRSGVFARRFDSAGNVIGASSRLTTRNGDSEGIEDSAAGVLEAAIGNKFPRIPRIPRVPRPSIPDVVPDAGDADGDTNTDAQGEFRVHADPEHTQKDPAIAMDSRGNTVVTWERSLSGGPINTDVFARTFDASGNPAGSEFRVHADNLETQHDPEVAINDEGNILFVWTSDGQEADDSQASYGIFARRYDRRGPTGGEFQVNDYTVDAQVHPQVVMTQQGDSLVLWDSIGSFNDLSARYLSLGGASSSEFVVESLSSSPQIAMDGDGNVVITSVWNSTQIKGHQIQLPDQVLINEDTVYELSTRVGSPDIALNGSGEGVLVWVIEEQDGSDDGVFAQRFTVDSQGGVIQDGLKDNPKAEMSMQHLVPLSLGASGSVLLGLWLMISACQWIIKR